MMSQDEQGSQKRRGVQAQRRSRVVMEISKPKTTEEWQAVFLQALAATGNVSSAARVAKMDRNVVLKHRKSTPAFAEAWEHAIEEYVDAIEAQASKLAKSGHAGMIQFLLKARRPDIYGDKATVEHRITNVERREIEAMAKKEGLSDEEARLIVAEVEADMNRKMLQRSNRGA